jgi:hypothetical protein
MITARMDMITRAAETAIEAREITSLRPSIVGALVISALQAPTGLPMVETDLSTSSPTRSSHSGRLSSTTFTSLSNGPRGTGKTYPLWISS